MNKITSMQLFSLLLLQGIWELFCLRSIPGSGAMLGAAGAYLLQMLLLLPLLSGSWDLVRRKWVGLCYALCFILCGARNLQQLSDAAPEALLSVPGKAGAAVLLLLTCLYTAVAGIRAAARCAPLTLTLFALTLLVLLAGAWGHTVPERFHWEREGLSAGTRLFFFSTELPALWVLLRRMHGSPRRVVLGYTLAKTGIMALLVYLCITVGGRLGRTAEYPVFTLTALSQPLQGQRADALYILVFVMLCVMQLTVQAGLTAHLVEELFPRLHHTAPAALLVMLGLAGGCSPALLEDLTGMTVPVLAFGLPCTVMLLGTLRRRSAA